MIKFCEPLKDRTTFKIGGPAYIYAEPKESTELEYLLSLAKKEGFAVLALGSGSNILPSDSGVNALVIRLSSPFFQKLIFKKNIAQAGSGVMLAGFVQSAKKKGLGGLEFLAGIPGTVGGALAMNAGAWGGWIGDFVEEVSVLDQFGRTKVLKKNKIKFGYRNSSLAKFIILSAKFKLVPKKQSQISAQIKDYASKRGIAQDYSYPSAGCIFKNPLKDSAGRLIDACGLKGKSVGGAMVSNKHANFILNKSNASSDDVLKLIDIVKKRVYKKFRVNLQPEIRIWK